ncbi:hypothetical protein CEB3_c42670 [Peptococcaceae bacterium CEB3]|nr:hypothetical protein CEB3_c42670 [Peptococcaceae bacterium CEB3]
MPMVVYVNAAWAGLPPGTTVGPGQTIGTNAFATIQDGVNGTAPKGTVQVSAGVYNENVTISQPLQLHGAQYGVDARTRSSAAPTTESVINGSSINGTISIGADDVVVDGFTLQNNASGPAVTANHTYSGTWIFNNIVRNNVFGLYLNPSGSAYSQVKQNYFVNNNLPGAASGNAIYSDGGAVNYFIYRNTITGHISGSVALYGASGTQQNIVIAMNDIIHDAPIAMIHASNVKVMENTIQNLPYEGISLQGGDNNVDIEANVLQNNARQGVSVNNAFAPESNSNIRMKYNAIQGNASGGLLVTAGSYTGTLDATNDWWGDPSGPSVNGDGPGTGQAITDPDKVVLFQPFLTSNPFAPVSHVVTLTSGPMVTDGANSLRIAIDNDSQTNAAVIELEVFYASVSLTGAQKVPFVHELFSIAPGNVVTHHVTVNFTEEYVVQVAVSGVSPSDVVVSIFAMDTIGKQIGAQRVLQAEQTPISAITPAS